VYEGGLRVPGLMEWPARLKQPRVINMPCGTIDIFPTVLEVAGVQAPNDRPLDGISLVPLLDGRMSERSKPVGFWHYAIRGIGVNSSKLLADLAQEQAAGNVRPWSQLQPMPPE